MVNFKHVLKRTNHKSEKFVGVCLVCGEKNLTRADINKQCSNPNKITQAQAFQLILTRIE